jgi:nucleotide-binding universal stress UspA family protein
MSRAILVATDGDAGATGALRVARLISDRRGAPVEVLSVLKPVELYPYSWAAHRWGPTGSALFAEKRAAGLRARVERQLATLDPVPDGGRSLRLVVGPVAPSIAHTANRLGAGMIVLGLGRALGTGLLARDTVLRVLQLATAPVLSVPAETTELPRRAVVAVDASEPSIRVAASTLWLLQPDSELHLAHAVWDPDPLLARNPPEGWMETHRAAVEARLHEWAAMLSALQPEVDIRTHILEGEPGREVLGLADRLAAGLVAAGSHGLGFWGRVLLGSVSTQFVRGARCCVLIEPMEARGAASTPRTASFGEGSLPEAVLAPRPPRPVDSLDADAAAGPVGRHGSRRP